MTKETLSFPSADGRTTIHGFRWIPEGEIRWILQLNHGMVEYIGRYDAFAAWLAEQGILCVGHDHLGHGGSVTGQEEWGYFDKAHPSGVLMEDMHALRVLTQKAYPGIPYFMLGHSMGSYLLRKYLALHGAGLAGALLLGVGGVPGSAAAFGVGLCHVIAALRGGHGHSRLLEGLAMGGGAYRQFDATGKEPERSWLTRDTDLVERFYKEPRCTFRFTVNGYQGLFEAVRDAADRELAGQIPKDLPLLLASGDRDPVGDLGEGVRRVEALYREAGIRDLTLKLYPGARHEILNETNRQEVWQDLYDWMEVRCP